MAEAVADTRSLVLSGERPDTSEEERAVDRGAAGWWGYLLLEASHIRTWGARKRSKSNSSNPCGNEANMALSSCTRGWEAVDDLSRDVQCECEQSRSLVGERTCGESTVSIVVKSSSDSAVRTRAGQLLTAAKCYHEEEGTYEEEAERSVTGGGRANSFINTRCSAQFFLSPTRSSLV